MSISVIELPWLHRRSISRTFYQENQLLHLRRAGLIAVGIFLGVASAQGQAGPQSVAASEVVQPGSKPSVGNHILESVSNCNIRALDGERESSEPITRVPILTQATISSSVDEFLKTATNMSSCVGWFVSSNQSAPHQPDNTDDGDNPANEGKPRVTAVPKVSATDFGREFYYKNKTEFGMDIGWLPINIPFAFDIFLGDGYNNPPLYYTLVPVIGSIRWQISDIDGPWLFRGNWELQASGAVVVFPQGPESHYFAWILGARRNFVPKRGRIDPYFDFRMGLGGVDSKEPKGVQFAQGENFTFTLNVGSGVRYNFNQRFAFSAGLHYMHISNLYLSEPRYPNYGINVYGPMIGMDMRLGKPHGGASE